MEYNDKLVESLWAKKEDYNGQLFWLSLKQHLNDTMRVSRWLWLNWLSESQRSLCLNCLGLSDNESGANLASFLGAVHDIGKATPAFQTQKNVYGKHDLDKKIIEKLETAGFCDLSSLILVDAKKSHHSLSGEYLLKHEFQVKDDIGSIVGAHHGTPVDCLSTLEEQSAYFANYFQCENDKTKIDKWKYVQKEIFYWALHSSGYECVEQLPRISKPAQVIYSGLLIMADWIASNSDYFPLESICCESITDSDRFRNGIKLWGEHTSYRMAHCPIIEKMFINRFGFEPRDFQRVVYQTSSLIKKPGIIIIEAPMGLGKTEAALAAAEILSFKSGTSGLFFGLPTQATSNGMFGRVHDWLKKIAKEYGTPLSLRLCHAKASLNDEMNDLLNKTSVKNINVDEKTDGYVFVNEWFTGRKKTALDDFVVGTVDNFLLSALKQNHLALRHLGFSKKIVIIDEVHAYDAYMQQYLKEAISWMGAYGVPVILTSATLHQRTREELIKAYLKGSGVKKTGKIVFPSEMFENCYPLISYSDGENVKAQTKFVPIKNKIVHIKRINDESLLELISERINDGGVIGIVVNTIKRAQYLGKKCKEFFGCDVVEILHSSFMATDRVFKETNLLNTIGKSGERPSRKIIIGTQVIEQSLDIDFDVLFTDLCPIDLMLQRIGRLHRHDRKRPVKHETPITYVMGTDEQLNFETGTERIYDKYFLIRTQYFLAEVIQIPSDIPVLINRVYGDSELELAENLMLIYKKSKQMYEIQRKNDEDRAKTYRIQSPIPLGNNIRPDLIGWLNNSSHFDSDEMIVAQVRDIKESIEIVALKRVGTGYGTFENEIDISKRIKEPSIAQEIAKQTIRLPDWVSNKCGISKTIDYLEKYNSNYLHDWQEQPWLKGSLGIIFDENNRFEINGVQLNYDNEFGLREDKNYGEV